MKDRIALIMQKSGLSNAEFAEKIGISTSSLSHIYSERNKPSLEVILRIHKAYPRISIKWLISGEGEMEEASPSDGRETDAQNVENPKFAGEHTIASEFSKENGSESTVYAPKEIVREEVRYVEKPHPKITEIRIFFDNGTYEVFKPEK